MRNEHEDVLILKKLLPIVLKNFSKSKCTKGGRRFTNKKRLEHKPEISTWACDNVILAWLSHHFGSPNVLVHKLDSLEELASRDLWESTLNKVFYARSLNLITNPHDHLIYFTYNILVFSKLGCFMDSSNELYTLND
ncbi:hypothetical protein J1N35_018051 [Gossypium stocksii]|uniref:Uncharacterized protein n=1 Tax=Gossypium stocksii TaxID=47602 RepID=A0A9D3VNH4_9ROSI|nr:hypothetical protein J1N35_018051 [Gossypium stocksii]